MLNIDLAGGAQLYCEKGTTVRELLTNAAFPDLWKTVACRVNHIQRPLSWELSIDSLVEPVTTDSIEGIEVYTCTVAFMLTAAATRIKNIRLHLTQSMSYSYYYESPERELTPEDCSDIEAEMRRMVRDNEPITRETMPADEAREIMRKQNYADKERLLFYTGTDPVILYKCSGVYDFFGGALADSAGITPTFELRSYKGGIFISGPTLSDPSHTMAFIESPKLFDLIDRHTYWLQKLQISTAAEIHAIVTAGRSNEMIMGCEAEHTKVLANIAAKIKERGNVGLICLAGPSSSGKTTSSRRLSVQLLTYGITAATLELDNYFVNRDKTPVGRDGKYDFEALEALDLDLINENISDLLAGKEAEIPRFDFVAGKRTKGKTMKLDPGQVLVIEGIHGLNDRLTESVPAERKFRVFISPLTGTNIDFHNRIGTTDTRLLRRMVRDARTRGHSAEATLKMWPSVVRGAHRFIFPYTANADALFNTSLPYEICVLKGYVMPLLMTVGEDSPVYGEALRLRSMLEYLPVIPSDDVPNLSLIREFIGGSCFE